MLVSAFVFGGIPYQAVSRLLEETEIWVSPELLREYREVPGELLAEGKVSPEQMKILVAGIASFVSDAKASITRKLLDISRDPEDNMILECCLAAKAHLVITGDRDLLEINPRTLQASGLRRLKILSPAKYLRES